MLSQSFTDMVRKLSKLQREFLIDHVSGMKPFIDNPMECMTRESMLIRGLIRFEPDVKTRLGVPDGTMLTDAGREALCYILGQYADALMRAIAARKIDPHREADLFRILHETAMHWSSQNAINRRAGA